VDLGIALIVVPVIVGVLAAGVRLGLPPPYEAPLAMTVGLLIFVGYTLAQQVPGGATVAEAALRGLAVGLSSAGLLAAARRLGEDRHARR
jgi:hypothetical protein